MALVREKTGISKEETERISVTGTGAQYIAFANAQLPESVCLARGIDFLLPSTRIVLDLGARKSLAVKCKEGKALKLAASSKCAAGAGAYLKTVANIFNIDTEEMSNLSFKSTVDLEIQTNCAVFAESEIISLIHNGAKPEDILKGVFRGLAERIFSQLLEIGKEQAIAATGGFSANKALIHSLEELVGFKIMVPEHPEIVGALGAALLGERARSAIS